MFLLTYIVFKWIGIFALLQLGHGVLSNPSSSLVAVINVPIACKKATAMLMFCCTSCL